MLNRIIPMSRRQLATGIAAALTASLAAVMPVSAQAPPVDQQLQSLDAAAPGQVPLPLAQRILTGREDLLVLKRHRFFTAYAAPTYTWTSNANFSDENKVSDRIAAFSAGLIAATQIAERYDVYAQVGYIGSRYGKSRELEFNGWQAKLGVAVTEALTGIRVNAAYEPTSLYSDDTGDRLLTQHAMNLTASRDHDLGRGFILTPLASLSFTPSSPNDYSAFAARAGLYATYFVRPDVALVWSADLTRKVYRDYFQDVYDRERKDTVFSLSGGLHWTINDRANAAFVATYSKGNSTLDPFDYHATGFSPTARLGMRF